MADGEIYSEVIRTKPLSPDGMVSIQWERHSRARMDELGYGLIDRVLNRLFGEAVMVVESPEAVTRMQPRSREKIQELTRLFIQAQEREQNMTDAERREREAFTEELRAITGNDSLTKDQKHKKLIELVNRGLDTAPKPA